MTAADGDLDAGIFDPDTPDAGRRPPELFRRRRPGGFRPPQPRRPRYRTGTPPGPANFYPDVAAFMTGFLSPTFAREWHEQDAERRWCSSWWLHTEAVVRLEALWKAWETLRHDPGTGASSWLRDHADPTLQALTSPLGPFARCKPGRHHTCRHWSSTRHHPACSRPRHEPPAPPCPQTGRSVARYGAAAATRFAIS